MRYNTRMDIYRKCDLAAGDSVTVSRQGRVTAYTLRNAGGSGIVEAHELFEGAQVLYDDMHLSTFGEGGEEVGAFVVEHCRFGRFEGAFRDGRQFFLGAGDVCVHRVVNRSAFSSRFPTRHYHGITVMLDLPAGDFSEFLRLSGIDLAALSQKYFSKDISCVIRGDERAGRIFEDFYRARENKDVGYLRLKLAELLHFLQEFSPQENAAQAQALPPDIVSAMKSAEEYLWENLASPLTVKELGAKFGFSATSFKNYFKTVFGYPVHEYIFTCRMQIAQYELVRTDKKISAVAREAGYASASKFSDAFRRFSGQSPREYRKNNILSEWSIIMPVRD